MRTGNERNRDNGRYDQSPHERATAPASCISKSSGYGGASGLRGSLGESMCS